MNEARTQRQTAEGDGNRAVDAYRTLRELIVRGRLSPGLRIVEADVAERLGISRTPLRSAIQRLQQEGYVQSWTRGRQSQAVVAPLTRADAFELFRIVGAVEGVGAEGAAQMGEEARSRLVVELEALNMELLEASEEDRPDHDRIFELDANFHRKYTAAGAGPRLIALHDAIKPQAERYLRLYVSALLDQVGRSVREHAATVRAIQAGNPEAAEEAVRVNWRNAGSRLGGVIDSMGERGVW